jgi:hypothetical protein
MRPVPMIRDHDHLHISEINRVEKRMRYMSRIFFTMALTVGVGAVINPAGAQTRPSVNSAPATLFAVSGFDSVPMKGCTGTPGSPVTIDLDDVLDQLTKGGKISRKIARKNGKKVEFPVGKNDNWPTSLDMKLSEPNVKNDYVMVTVNLPIWRGTTFLRPLYGQNGYPSSADDSSIAVTVKSGTADQYCGRTIVTTKKETPRDIQTFSFGVRKSPGVRAINIGILVPGGSEEGRLVWLPILLDPAVENEG